MRIRDHKPNCSLGSRASGLALVAGLALVLSSSSAHAQKVLRYQFREGEQRDVRIDQDLKLSIGIGDQNLKVQMKQDIRFRNEVVALEPDGNARIRQRVTRVTMTSDGIPGADFQFDSTSDEEPKGIAALVAPIFRAMMEGDIKLTMSPRGEIGNIELPPAMLTAVERASGLPGVADMLSKESMSQMMKQSAVSFPAEGVQVGESWSSVVETKTASTGKQTVTTKYTYQGEEDVEGRTLDKIGMTMELQFGDAPEGVQLKVTDQNSSGLLFFDNMTGELVKSNMDQVMTMEVQAAGNAIKQILETKVNVTTE